MALSVPPAVLPPVVLAMMEVLAARMIAPATATATVTAVASGRHPVVLQLDVAHHLALGPQDVTGGQDDQDQQQTDLHGPFDVADCFHIGLGCGF